MAKGDSPEFFKMAEVHQKAPHTLQSIPGGRKKNHQNDDTVHGSEIRGSPVEGTVVEISLFTRFDTSERWLFGIS